jgi:membrane protease YdiL (CAAX protease family)
MPPAPTTAPMTSPIPSEPRTPSLYHAAPRGAVAVSLALAAIGTILFLQIVLASAGAPVEVGLGVSFAAAIGVLVLATRRMPDAPGVLGVRRTPWRFIAAGVLVGGSSWYVRLRLVELLVIPDHTQGLRAAAVDTNLVAALVTVALLPAIAEELIFRGVIARSLARRSQLLAIGVSATLFAIYHVVPIQIVAVFPFGLALAFIAVRADSIVPTIVAHAINNVIGIAIARGDMPGLARVIDRSPPLALAGSSLLVVVGLALAWKVAA